RLLGAIAATRARDGRLEEATATLHLATALGAAIGESVVDGEAPGAARSDRSSS
ncbi:MAG: hypothetical protein H7138_04435, partial [Myxococcales bacterium]|nr:hypothetical protein [Myxococcales bacterium]